MERLDRRDLAVAAGLAVAAALLRVPYRARLLYNWDAVQFALALGEYDVAKHQPHPPGYILYVGLGRLVNLVVGDPAATYVLLAMAFSGLATGAVYLVGREMWSRPTGAIAATLLAASPLHWFYGSVGLTYGAEALGASVVALLAHRALHGSHRAAVLAAGWLGVAGGLRPSLIVLFLPLWFGAAWAGARERRRALAQGFLALGLATLGWLVPMLWLTGGLARYLTVSLHLADSIIRPTSVLAGDLPGTLRTLGRVAASILVGLGPAVFLGALLPRYVREIGWGRREWLLALWVLPPLAVYALVHFGQAGYALTVLPAVLLLLSAALVHARGPSARRPRGPAAAWAHRPAVRAAAVGAVVAVLVGVNGVFFVRARPLERAVDGAAGDWRNAARNEAAEWIFSRTAAALREHEEVIATFVGAIRGLHDPASTVVITEVGNARSYPWLRHATYYLPEYPIVELKVGALQAGHYAPRGAGALRYEAGSTVPLPPGTRRLVWFVDHWSPSAAHPPGLVELELPYGRYLYVLPVGRRPIAYAGYTLTPAPRLKRAPEPSARRPRGPTGLAS